MMVLKTGLSSGLAFAMRSSPMPTSAAVALRAGLAGFAADASLGGFAFVPDASLAAFVPEASLTAFAPEASLGFAPLASAAPAIASISPSNHASGSAVGFDDSDSPSFGG